MQFDIFISAQLEFQKEKKGRSVIKIAWIINETRSL